MQIQESWFSLQGHYVEVWTRPKRRGQHGSAQPWLCVSVMVNKSQDDIRVSLQICLRTRVMVQIKDQTRPPCEVWCMDNRLQVTHGFLPPSPAVATLTRWMEEPGRHLTHIPQSTTFIIPSPTLCSHSRLPGWQVLILTECRCEVWAHWQAAAVSGICSFCPSNSFENRVFYFKVTLIAKHC